MFSNRDLMLSTSTGLVVSLLPLIGLAERATAYRTEGDRPLFVVQAPQTPSQTPPAIAQARPILQRGDQGEAVEELQALLSLLGYYEGAIDGLYETGTVAAVERFQAAAGLAVDGIVGPLTWRYLLPASAVAEATPAPAPSPAPTPAPTPAPSPSPAPSPAPAPRPSPSPSPDPTYVELPILRVGMQGPAIAQLQERLRTAGYYNGAIDGIFGPQTESAVQALQRSNALDSDGVVGPATWNVLLR